MTTMRRAVAAENGQLTAPAGGQWISRKVDRDVTSRPIGWGAEEFQESLRNSMRFP